MRLSEHVQLNACWTAGMCHICIAHRVCVPLNSCYPCAVCARVMHLCPSVYIYMCVCVCVCVCVSSKNTPVCVLQLENLHENTLCSFFTEFIVLWRRFLCWQTLFERLIHGYLKLRVPCIRALYGIVGVSPNLLHVDVLTQSHMYRTSEPFSNVRVAVMQE